MNIVKIQDVNLVNEIENFNHFKGKYCYCVNWKYIFTFNDLTEVDYVKLSLALSENSIENTDYNSLIYGDYNLFLEKNAIDLLATEKANLPNKYIEFNKFIPDSELTFDEVKRFRTWLASTLLNLSDNLTPEKYKAVFQYYSDEMNDQVKKQLQMFESNPVQGIFEQVSGSTCGCSQQGYSGITGVSYCNPIEIYSKSIYNEMVKIFSDIDFWLEKENEFLLEIKKYIDYILDANLPLINSKYASPFLNCNCLTNQNEAKDRAKETLKNLSEVFSILSTKELTGKKNFISTTLYSWASNLYEKMRWY